MNNSPWADQLPPELASKGLRRWPTFIGGLLIGLLLGAGVAVGIFLALPNRPLGLRVSAAANPASVRKEADSTPTNEEVLDYIDGKSFAIPTKDVKEQVTRVLVDRRGVVELKWISGSQTTGYENPWTERYSCLFHDGARPYILDFSVKVRPVGTKRAFLGVDFDGITPVEKVVTPMK